MAMFPTGPGALRGRVAMIAENACFHCFVRHMCQECSKKQAKGSRRENRATAREKIECHAQRAASVTR